MRGRRVSVSFRGCSRNHQQIVLRGTCETRPQESPLQRERPLEGACPQRMTIPAPGTLPIDCLVPLSVPKQQVHAPIPVAVFLVLQDIWDATLPPLATSFGGTPLSLWSRRCHLLDVISPLTGPLSGLGGMLAHSPVYSYSSPQDSCL